MSESEWTKGNLEYVQKGLHTANKQRREIRGSGHKNKTGADNQDNQGKTKHKTLKTNKYKNKTESATFN